MYNIKVMSCIEALAYVYNKSGNPDNKKYAIISIQEYTNGYGIGLAFKKGGNCLDALNLEFSDITPKLFDGADKDVLTNCKLMNMQDAKMIHDFVEGLINEVETLIIHCHAGVSRSAAVAAAISLVKFGTDKEYFESDLYCPNMHVYYNVLESYGLSNRYDSQN